MSDGLIPGTNLPNKKFDGMFSTFEPLIKATNGLTLSQVCAITGLESSTIQNWVKRHFVARPIKKKYHERQLARILLISSLRDSMKIESIGELMRMVNGSTDDESDDIISEDKMYDYFCKISMSVKDNDVSMNDISALVEDTLSDYNAPSENAKKRLCDALTVMVLAYISSVYKQRAEQMLNSIREDVK